MALNSIELALSQFEYYISWFWSLEKIKSALENTSDLKHALYVTWRYKLPFLSLVEHCIAIATNSETIPSRTIKFFTIVSKWKGRNAISRNRNRIRNRKRYFMVKIQCKIYIPKLTNTLSQLKNVIIFTHVSSFYDTVFRELKFESSFVEPCVHPG